MDVIYGLIPGMILIGLIAVGVFFWAARSGQFDDMDGAAHRILMDDDDPLLPENAARRRRDALAKERGEESEEAPQERRDQFPS